MDYAYQYLEKFGAMKESDYPYEARDDSCRFNADKVVTKVSSYTDVKQNEAALKVASSGHVVSVAVDAEPWQFYGGGILPST